MDELRGKSALVEIAVSNLLQFFLGCDICRYWGHVPAPTLLASFITSNLPEKCYRSYFGDMSPESGWWEGHLRQKPLVLEEGGWDWQQHQSGDSSEDARRNFAHSL